MNKKKIKPKRKKVRINRLFLYPFLILIIGFAVGTYFYSNQTVQANVVKKYHLLLNEKKYEEIYDLVQVDMSREDFTQRIKNIYEGIEAKNISITISTNTITRKNDNKKNEANIDVVQISEEPVNINYRLTMNTVAGDMDIKNTMPVVKDGDTYKIKWNSTMIFPDLENDEKIRVRKIPAKRGTIYDRNDKALAKDSSIYEIGIVPDKIEDKSDIQKIADMLEISRNKIEEKININTTNNEFVELKRISKQEQELKNELLKIKGIKVSDTEARVYPYKNATSIMTGYVQDGDGKTGLEHSFNDKLKGEDGVEIYIDKEGLIKKSLLKKEEKNGEDVKLTIDAEVQKNIYDEFQDDESCVVAIDYNTGEIKALVSTPSFDANKFSLGISQEEWDTIQNDDRNPMYNRYLAVYTPGSTMKPIMGAIGLSTESFTSDEDFGRSGKKWQKDSSWGNFWITTLKDYQEPANLENALIQSDNIYFAKAALKIGKNKIEEKLNNFGFNSKLEFSQEIQTSTYGSLDNEKTIANTGFGQAQLLVNPILMSSIYSCFANGGNTVKPYIEFEENQEEKAKISKTEIISKEISNEIKEDLIKVIENGSGKIDGKILAGKTGTAEIKKDQNDKEGTENGWFDVFDEHGNLYIAMIQDVKNRNGSKYVVEKMKSLFEKE